MSHLPSLLTRPTTTTSSSQYPYITLPDYTCNHSIQQFTCYRYRSLNLLEPNKWEYYEQSNNPIFNLSINQSIKSIHRSPINDLTLDRVENRYLLSVNQSNNRTNNQIALYDTETDVETNGYHERLPISQTTNQSIKNINVIEWYPIDTGMFFTGGADQSISLWDTNDFIVKYTFTVKSSIHQTFNQSTNQSINDLAMSPITTGLSNHLIAVAQTNNQSIRLIDCLSGSASHSLMGHTDDVICVEWAHHNEFMLASGSRDKVRQTAFKRLISQSINQSMHQSVNHSISTPFPFSSKAHCHHVTNFILSLGNVVLSISSSHHVCILTEVFDGKTIDRSKLDARYNSQIIKCQIM